MSDEIRNCEFRFKCPKTWDSLEPTVIASQRYCGQCQKVVHHCHTANELQWAIVRNLCVAVEAHKRSSTDHATQGDGDLMDIGMVALEYFANKKP